MDAERSTGELSLSSADPREQPVIKLGYLADPDDLRRLAHNVRTGLKLLSGPEFSRLGVKVAAPTPAQQTTDEALHTYIKSNLQTSLHTMRSARMGPASNPESVVDQRFRVHGVEGLRVVDISTIPEVIRRGPAASAVMLGERGAHFFEEDSSSNGTRAGAEVEEPAAS
jgi:choline dehydrogenase-like flavoprotein